MGTEQVEMQLDERVVVELDLWRSRHTPPPSRSEAARLLLEERLCGLSQPRRESTPAIAEWSLQPETLGALYALDRVPGFGPVKFREMHEAGIAHKRRSKTPSGSRSAAVRETSSVLPSAPSRPRTWPTHGLAPTSSCDVRRSTPPPSSST